jgi:hypothetical protein
MSTNLTPTQRLTCLLALLDEVIKLDEERTPGEWEIESNGAESEVVLPGNESLIDDHEHEWAESTAFIATNNASFIASASVSHGRNARALKDELLALDTLYHGNPGLEVMRWVENRRHSILSHYPDEILKRYL